MTQWLIEEAATAALRFAELQPARSEAQEERLEAMARSVLERGRRAIR